eukprot:2355912-Prymnesium_polylepis.1
MHVGCLEAGAWKVPGRRLDRQSVYEHPHHTLSTLSTVTMSTTCRSLHLPSLNVRTIRSALITRSDARVACCPKTAVSSDASSTPSPWRVPG